MFSRFPPDTTSSTVLASLVLPANIRSILPILSKDQVVCECVIGMIMNEMAIMGNYGKLWEILGNRGQLCEIMGNYGRFWAIMGDLAQVTRSTAPPATVATLVRGGGASLERSPRCKPAVGTRELA